MAARIGIDTRNLALSHGTGVATYARILAETCQSIGFIPQYLQATPLANDAVRLAHALLPGRHVNDHFSAPDIYRVAHIHFKIYHRLMKLRIDRPPDLMHWTYPLPLFLSGCINIVTIHDLIALQQPELTSINGRRLRKLLGLLLQRFDGIITVSETVRAELINLFGISPARVQTLYQAADISPSEAAGPPLCPPGSFIVAGSVEPRKNIRRLIAAHQASKVTARLVIIGPDGNGADRELAGMGDNVIRIPHCARPDLLNAMRQSRAVLFPSLAEGFGLPIIEAFASGVPVMTSSGGATGEIAGGAALLVNPYDVDAMSQTIRQLAQDDGLCARLSASGLARSQFFSTDAYAARLRAFYGAILNS